MGGYLVYEASGMVSRVEANDDDDDDLLCTLKLKWYDLLPQSCESKEDLGRCLDIEKVAFVYTKETAIDILVRSSSS